MSYFEDYIILLEHLKKFKYKFKIYAIYLDNKRSLSIA